MATATLLEVVPCNQPTNVVSRGQGSISRRVTKRSTQTAEECFEGSEVEELLTVEELAALLRVPPSWIYSRTRRRSADRIPGFRLGKYWRFFRADVVAWLNRQSAGCPNA